MPDFAIIFPAAGASQRFGTGRSKLLEPLGDSTVIARSVGAFAGRSDVSAIVIACRSIDETPLRESLRQWADDPRFIWCEGGNSRAETVRNALAAVPTDVEWVAVHDGARPMVSQAVIDRTFAAAVAHGAAVPAQQVHLTIKQATGPLPAQVVRTIPRHDLWAMQTPQAMRRTDLIDAFARCPLPLEQVTDDVQLIELAGKPVWLVDGDPANIKITTAVDMRVVGSMR